MCFKGRLRFFFNKAQKKKKIELRFVPSYKCVENPGCHSLLRPELLTQYRAVIRPSADQTVFYLPALTWILRFSAQLNAPSCSPETEPTPHCPSLSLLCRSFPCISEIAAICLRGGTPWFKRAPSETTLLSTI